MAHSYTIIKQKQHRIIHNTVTGLKVHIFNLDNERYSAAPHQVRLFATTDTAKYAFETINFNPDDAAGLGMAMAWFAQHFNQPNMVVTPIDPRPLVN